MGSREYLGSLFRYILKEYIAGSDRSIYESRQLRFMIEECDTGTSVGIVDLFDFEPHPNRAACGIMLDRRYQGRGFATEALRLLMEYAYTFLKLHQLYVHIPWRTSLARNYLPVWDLSRRGRLRTGSGHRMVIPMSA